MKLKSKTWTIVKFKINQFSGKIDKRFNPRDLNNKVKPQEIESILNKIENETQKFYFIRQYTKAKCVILTIILLLIIFVIINLSVYQKLEITLILLSVAILLTLLLAYISNSIYKKLIKDIQEITNLNLFHANENIFLKRRLYMISSTEYKYIAIYIIPLAVNLGVIILHNSTFSKIFSDDTPSINELIKINRSRDDLLSNKFTNFRQNYITNYDRHTKVPIK